ncbi:MAG: chlorite dismutase family protein [Myxococcota bacterium]|nr:chlorite dismutase family protein [Myxococcota bacterium]MDW8362778.1 chlorite dismutase family protein [Myxococcales bacterium]
MSSERDPAGASPSEAATAPRHGAAASHDEGHAPVDVSERGLPRDGQPQRLDRRLFMELLVLRAAPAVADDGRTVWFSPEAVLARMARGLECTGGRGVLYEDLHDPSSFGLLVWDEDPTRLGAMVRAAMAPLAEAHAPEDRWDVRRLVAPRVDYTMLGRTYSSGFEADLEHWLLRRPVEIVLEERWPWAIWYPLRRRGAFHRLERPEQGAILREHGTIGRAYGAADLAHDIRLACHGLDADDDEFVIGLVGKDLHPLSHVVQAMRATRQTSEYIEKMGPFFVGRAVRRVR